MRQNRVEKRQSTGQTLVEFALALPLLALLLFAIIQYGLILSGYITVRNASAVGARYAILGRETGVRPSITEIQNMTRSALSPMLQTNVSGLVINVSTNQLVGTAPVVRVEVRYPLRLIIPFVVPGPNPLVLRAATTAR